MSTIVIELPPRTRQALEEQAARSGKTPEELSRELIERGLQISDHLSPRTAREVLSQAQRVSPLSEALLGRITPDVSLDEVRNALNKTSGPLLSQIINEQRGAR